MLRMSLQSKAWDGLHHRAFQGLAGEWKMRTLEWRCQLYVAAGRFVADVKAKLTSPWSQWGAILMLGRMRTLKCSVVKLKHWKLNNVIKSCKIDLPFPYLDSIIGSHGSPISDISCLRHKAFIHSTEEVQGVAINISSYWNLTPKD